MGVAQGWFGGGQGAKSQEPWEWLDYPCLAWEWVQFSHSQWPNSNPFFCFFFALGGGLSRQVWGGRTHPQAKRGWLALGGGFGHPYFAHWGWLNHPQTGLWGGSATHLAKMEVVSYLLYFYFFSFFTTVFLF
jgi:hypothetical protein